MYNGLLGQVLEQVEGHHFTVLQPLKLGKD